MTVPARTQAAAVYPTITFHRLMEALSPSRLAAYSLQTDNDSSDAIARYMWNLALCGAFIPLLQAVEITFRNALYDVGCKTTAGRNLKFNRVKCWLDASPSILERIEASDVADALKRYPRASVSPGHLISFLGFGFWVRLCERPYEQGNSYGPQLWHSARSAFPHCPSAIRNREDIRNAFDAIRNWRNLIFHHQPIWDRDPMKEHRAAIEALGWMNRDLAMLLAATSPAMNVYKNGPAAYRKAAEKFVIVAQ